MDHLYQMTTGKRDDYINPMAMGSVTWRSVQSSEFGSKLAWEYWQQGGYETSTCICAAIARVSWIGAEFREYPTLSNMQAVNTFITKVEDIVSEGSRLPLLDVALQSTAARWWKNHRNTLSRWSRVVDALRARFKEDEGPRSRQRYSGTSNPQDHLRTCEE